jgi:hypothetical protein
MALPDDTRAKLEKHREAKLEADKVAADAADLKELEVYELKEKLASLGKENEDWRIINNPFGLFAVKKPDARAIKTFENAKDKDKISLEWNIAYLRHYIVPDDRVTVWMQTCGTRAGLAWQTMNEFLKLMGVESADNEKK